MAQAFSYPYPVLGNRDDIDGSFGVKLSIGSSREDFHLAGSFKLENSRIEELVAEKKVSFRLRLSCSQTYFRNSYRLESDKIDLRVPSDHLLNRVQYEPLIVATERIQNYCPSDAHRAYLGESFEIEAGQTVAVGHVGKILALKNFDPLTAPASSIIKIAKGDFDEGLPQYDYFSNVIEVKVSRKTWGHYQGVRDNVVRTIHSMVVAPVLAEAVRVIATPEEKEQVSDLLWCLRLEAMLIAKALSDSGKRPIEIAEILLEGSLGKGLEELDEGLHED